MSTLVYKVLKAEPQSAVDRIELHQSRVNRSMPQGLHYCQHTFESAIYQHGSVLMHVATGVTPDEIFGTPMNLNRSTVKSRSVHKVFSVEFSTIGDIDVIHDSGGVIEDEGCLTIVIRTKNPKTEKQQRLLLHYHGRAKSYLFMLAGWKSWIIRKSCYLAPLILNSDISSTNDFYDTTLQSLMETDYSDLEIREVLDDFSEEVLIDLPLKELCFKSRDIFSSLWRIANKSLTHKLTSAEAREHKLASSTHAHTTASFASRRLGSEAQNAECLAKLHAVALRRLLLFRSCIRLFCAICKNSDSIGCRYGLLRGPDPITLDAFVGLFALDAYQTINETLKCTPPQDDAVAHAHLTKSLEMAMVSSSGSIPTMPDLDLMFDDNLEFSEIKGENGLSTITPISSHRRMSQMAISVVSNLSDDILTPIKKRVEAQEALEQKSPFTLKLRQSISDLQTVGLFLLNDIVELAPTVNKKPLLQYVGEVLSRLEDFEDFLEVRLMKRLTSLLDNLLISDHVLQSLGSLANTAVIVAGGSVVKSPAREAKSSSRGKTEEAFDFDKPVAVAFPVDPLFIPPSPSKKRSDARGVQWASDASLPRPGHSIKATRQDSGHLFPDVHFAEEKDLDKSIDFVKPDALSEDPSKMKENQLMAFQLCEFETQECLLFYISSVIHTICLDSSKMRDTLGDNLSSYFTPILNVLNLLCPRPPRSKIEEDNKDFGSSKSPIRAKGGRNQQGFDLAPAVPQSSGAFSGIIDALCSPFTRGSGVVVSSAPEVSRDQAANDALLTNLNSKNIAIEDIDPVLMQCDLRVYGKPRYQMAPATWTLLLLTRRNIERVLDSLDLMIPLDQVMLEAYADIKSFEYTPAKGVGAKGGDGASALKRLSKPPRTPSSTGLGAGAGAGADEGQLSMSIDVGGGFDEGENGADDDLGFGPGPTTPKRPTRSDSPSRTSRPQSILKNASRSLKRDDSR
jgi:hypothetical protein